MAYLEGQLHGGALEEGRQTYPGYLVVATSAMGLLLTHKAREAALATTAVATLLNSIYVAKLTLLVLPQARSLTTAPVTEHITRKGILNSHACTSRCNC